MLAPDTAGQSRKAQDFAHSSPQMLPIETHRVDHEQIARELVDEGVKIHVRLHDRGSVATLCYRSATLDDRAAAFLAFFGQKRNCEAHRERLDRRTELIDRLEKLRIEWRDRKTTASGRAHETLRLEHEQRVVDRLTRNVEPLRDRVLRQPLTWLERAIGNGIEDHCIGLIHQGFRGNQRFHNSWSAALAGYPYTVYDNIAKWEVPKIQGV